MVAWANSIKNDKVRQQQVYKNQQIKQMGILSLRDDDKTSKERRFFLKFA
jgi:hypothetical protein